MWDNVIVIFEVLIRQFIWLMLPARRTQEILMLRKELQVLKRGANRPNLTSWDRLLLVSLLRLNERVLGNIVRYRFLRSHGQRFFTCDFLTVDTAFLRRLYVFVLMDMKHQANHKNCRKIWRGARLKRASA